MAANNFAQSIAQQLHAAIDNIVAPIGISPQDNPYVIQIPDPNDVDLSITDLASLVVRSANNYAHIARLSGMAKANAKLAKGRFDSKYKRLRAVGKNEAERESNAMEQCAAEHEALTEAEAIAAVIEALENAARVSSESSRKLLDKVYNHYQGVAAAERFGHSSSGGLSVPGQQALEFDPF